MKKNAKDFKKQFLESVNKYHLPTQNKSIFFYTLADSAMTDSENKELYQLLLTSICDNGYLLDKFQTPKTSKDEAKEYQKLQNRITKYCLAVESEQALEHLWQQITGKKTLPILKNIPHGLQEDCQTEVTFLCNLYRKFFLVTEQDSPELRNNLSTYVMITKTYSDYRLIAPFFFYQLMVKHTSRLATKNDFRLSPNNLWKYAEYNIFKNNEKNYKQYKTYGKLFLKLCKYYKADSKVNLPLCRYAFCHSSNLIEWLDYFKPQKSHKYKTPLARFYDQLNLNHHENYEPEIYDMYSIHKITEADFFYYYSEYGEELLEIENYLMNYIVEHAEYLILCMKNMYVDMQSLENMVQEIYDNANLKSMYPPSLPLDFQLADVYEILTKCLDMGVKAKVEAALRICEKFGGDCS